MAHAKSSVHLYIYIHVCMYVYVCIEAYKQMYMCYDVICMWAPATCSKVPCEMHHPPCTTPLLPKGRGLSKPRAIKAEGRPDQTRQRQRQDNTIPNKTRRDKPRQAETRPDEIMKGRTRHDKTRQYKTGAKKRRRIRQPPRDNTQHGRLPPSHDFRSTVPSIWLKSSRHLF